MEEPKRNNGADAAQYSFPVSTAVESGAEELIPGRATSTQNAVLLLKTHFVWVAGLSAKRHEAAAWRVHLAERNQILQNHRRDDS